MGLSRDAGVVQSGQHTEVFVEGPWGAEIQPALCSHSWEPRGCTYPEQEAAAESRDQPYLMLDPGSVLTSSQKRITMKCLAWCWQRTHAQ